MELRKKSPLPSEPWNRRFSAAHEHVRAFKKVRPMTVITLEKNSHKVDGVSYENKFSQPDIKRLSATGSCSTQSNRSSGSCLSDPHANV